MCSSESRDLFPRQKMVIISCWGKNQETNNEMSKICRKKSIISYTSDVGLQPWITSLERLLQLFEKGLRLEVFGDVVIQSCDYLVDLLFPRWINVLAGSDRLKEFFEGLFNDPAEAVGHLRNMDLVNGCPWVLPRPRNLELLTLSWLWKFA